MEQLDLLWDLEKHHNSLKRYDKELLKIKEVKSINSTEDLIINTEEKLNLFRLKNKDIKRKLMDSNKMLKEYNFKTKEIEESLYDGSTTNPKQLEYLSQEKDKLKEIINNTEIEILEFMDEVESMEKELADIDAKLQYIKDKDSKIKKDNILLADELANNIEVELDKIKTIEAKIDKSLLNQYMMIRKNSLTGIVEVKNGTCTGCNMMVPTFMIDKLNKRIEIIYCESCGRILCKH